MITNFFAPKNKRKQVAAEEPSEDDENHDNKRMKRTKEDKSATTKTASSKLSPEVEELIVSLEDGPWRRALLESSFLESASMINLARFIQRERKSKTIYPPPQDIFSFLNWTPLDQVKVVIVGQDPYHNPGQAHGLCFSVRKGVKVPASLKNMYKELLNDPQSGFTKSNNRQIPPTHGNLQRWAQQGVLLMNSVLTVPKNEANKHQKKGWEQLTDWLLKRLVQDRQEKDQGLVFLLWGKPAALKATTAIHAVARKKNLVTILQSSHPSPLAASKTSTPFLGSRCFSRANKALKEYGYDPIDWNVDGP